MSAFAWLLVAAAAVVAAYLLFVGTLFVFGRRQQARALAGFVPDCAILFTRLLRDPRVPRRSKLILAALVAYLAMPFDLVPDFIPVVGQLDDAILVVIVLRLVLRGARPALMETHWPGPKSSLELLLRLAGSKIPGPVSFAAQHRLFQNWRLVLKVAPVVACAALVKVLFDQLGWETISLNPLYTGLVAANVFLLGFLLAGTLADYKESEKLPGDLAASLETIADDCVNLHRAKQAGVALECLRHIRALAGSVLSWLNKREQTPAVLKNVSELNRFFLAFEPLTQPNYIVRLKQEQSAIRRMLIRIETIRDTSFVGAGYVIAKLTTLLLVVGLLLVDINPLLDATFVLCVITFLLVYMLLLIRDLDNPFDYRNGQAGAAEVSLQPLESLEDRVTRQIDALSGLPAERAATS